MVSSLQQHIEAYELARASKDAAEATAEEELSHILRIMRTECIDFAESDTGAFTLTSEKPSISWLKREYGFEDKELPPEIFQEKITKEMNVEAATKWLEEQGMELRITPKVSFRKKQMKVR